MVFFFGSRFGVCLVSQVQSSGQSVGELLKTSNVAAIIFQLCYMHVATLMYVTCFVVLCLSDQALARRRFYFVNIPQQP